MTWSVTTHSFDGAVFGAKINSEAVEVNIPPVHASAEAAHSAALAWIARWEKSLRQWPNAPAIEQTFEVTEQDVDAAIAALDPGPAEEPPAEEPPVEEPPVEEPPVEEVP